MRPLALLAALLLWVVACSAPAEPAIPSGTPSPPVEAGLEPTVTPSPSAAYADGDATAVLPPQSEPQASLPSPEALAQEAWSFLTILTEGYSPRASATREEERAARWLAAQLEDWGYQVAVQEFVVRTVPAEGPFVTTISPGEETLTARPLRGTGTGIHRGPLVAVGKALEGEIPPEGLRGAVALVERGVITFQLKVERAVDAGAEAVIVFNNRPGPFRGALLEQAAVPVVGISQEDGLRLLGLLAEGPVEVEVTVALEERLSRNIIARWEAPSSAPLVVVGAHYDTVPHVPGANDNGSGVSALLAVAQRMAQAGPGPLDLRFVLFGSEELGLLGSRHYLESLPSEERGRLRAMVNLDTLGSGGVTGVLGDEALVSMVLRAGEGAGLPVERQPELEGATSDYAPFQAAGVPVAFLFADDLSRIHTSEDAPEGVRAELLGSAAYLALALLRGLAAP